MREREAAIVGRHSGSRVRRGDMVQGLQELAAEVADAGEALPELFVHGLPGNELRPSRGDAMQALGQPGVSVERHRRRRQSRNGAVVERHCVLAKAMVILLAEANRGWPENALIDLLRKPQIESADELGV